jgi:hypothetical protein
MGSDLRLLVHEFLTFQFFPRQLKFIIIISYPRNMAAFFKEVIPYRGMVGSVTSATPMQAGDSEATRFRLLNSDRYISASVAALDTAHKIASRKSHCHTAYIHIPGTCTRCCPIPASPQRLIAVLADGGTFFEACPKAPSPPSAAGFSLSPSVLDVLIPSAHFSNPQRCILAAAARLPPPPIRRCHACILQRCGDWAFASRRAESGRFVVSAQLLDLMDP